MTLDDVRVAFQALLTEESSNHYRMGVLYNHVVVNKLADNTPFKNAQGFFAAHFKDLSRATLASYGSVATHFTAAVCGQFGATRLSLLVTYKEVAKIQVNHAEPGGTLIEVPDENGVVTNKPFSVCSVVDMRKALQRKRKRTSGPSLPAEDLVLVEHYRTAVTSRFPTQTPVRVSVRKLGGKTMISFQDIPLSEVDSLTEALIDGVPSLREVA
ncbi:MAG TPA: hypothetical protein VF815_40005 [Myxococcaceae bacterium]